MKICFIPIDNRPVCYDLAKDIVAIDNDIELLIPPKNYLGGLHKVADINKIFEWLKHCPKVDAMIISLDTLAYGGLISSRRSNESINLIKERLNVLKNILYEKNAKIYAFSSIMRISNNNYNEEEKEYWKDYGKKIFEYSYSDGKNKSDIPDEIIEDYLITRERNFKINKIYLDWQKEGLFDTLIFSKDDCAEFGFNIKEAKELENMGGKIKTGADEIPLALLSRAINKTINVFVKFLEPDYVNLISNYEDVPIKQSVLNQLELSGFSVVNEEDKAELILLVNNFKEKQGEHVMGWDTLLNSSDFEIPNKPYCIADVRYANGADNIFVENLLKKITLDNFYGYAGWNTSANTLGSLLAGAKIRFKPVKYNEKAFKKLQFIRFLDDWAYQANVRKIIDYPADIKDFMKKYEIKLSEILNFIIENPISYNYPWKRKFEIEININ